MTTTGEYWIGPSIGEGSFGQVFYCKHKVTERKVAIKVVEQITLRKNEVAMKGVLAERKWLHQLAKSPNVVTLLASFLDSQYVYLVMELSSGGDMNNLIQRGLAISSKSTDEAKRWRESIQYYFRQLVSAIRWLHNSAQLIHCDLKPQNILLTANGRLHLADFACAIPSRKKEENNDPNLLGSEKTAFLRGTAAYSCPELIRANEAITPAVDYWSLGCILFAFFHGESLFHADSEALVIKTVTEFETTPSKESFVRATFDRFRLRLPMSDGWIPVLLSVLHPCATARSQSWMKLVEQPNAPLTSPADDASSVFCDLDGKFMAPQEGIVLPVASWQERCETTKLRNGDAGWVAFC